MRRALAGLLFVPFAMGCGLVFGISSGELDPDALGDGGRADVATDSNPPTDAPVKCDDPLLIDDLEDGNAAIPRCAGRQGAWSVFNDETAGGTQSPSPGAPFTLGTPGAPESSKFAAHTSGRGYKKAGMRFALNQVPGSERETYDASGYSGIRFRAKMAEPLQKVYLNVRDKSRDPAGGVCTPGVCGDLFGEGFPVTTEWQEFKVTWDKLEPDKDAGAAKVDSAHVYAIDFHVYSQEMIAFDFWVDDVAFLP
ncbi:hypothetical protein LVJ94_42965 [Pendulispora rubella]|uniref:CBM11 domain-containing protein n=1 Tax=Pendulispora rubella TaxID=2741070 RepID=A0ABZ2KY86_9BACT